MKKKKINRDFKKLVNDNKIKNKNYTLSLSTAHPVSLFCRAETTPFGSYEIKNKKEKTNETTKKK